MNLKKYTPVILAIVLFAIITLIQFKPLYSGKVIRQSDITQHTGISKEIVDYRNTENKEPFWTNSIFGGMPAYQISTLYPGNWMGYVDKVFHLFLPHPSGYLFMYFLGFFILLLCLGINPWLAVTGALAYGFSSYFFIILEVGHNSKANAIGYLAPVLGGIILLMRGKYGLGFAITSLFTALELNANHVQISYYGFILFALVFLSYLINAVKQKTLKPYFIGMALFISATVVGILPNSASLLTTYEYGKYSTRGPTELTIDETLKSNKLNKTSGLDKDYATQYSYGVSEIFTFLIPNYKGGASVPIAYANNKALKNVDPQMREQVAQANAYFGDQFSTAGPVYVGAIIVLLAFLGLFIIDHPIKWALIAATLLSVMLAWGKNFMGLTSFFMDYFPMYNKFRAVSMTLVIAELTLPLLAVLALDRLIKINTQKEVTWIKVPFTTKPIDLKKVVLISFAAVGGFCLLCVLAPNVVNTFSSTNEEMEITNQFKQSGATNQQIAQFLPAYLSNITIARTSIFTSDVQRSLLFVTLTAVLLYLYITKKVKLNLFFILFAFFIIADLWPVAARYLNDKNFVTKTDNNAPFIKSKADEQILLDKSLDYRVLNLSVDPFTNATTSYYHKSIGGYHAARLKKYDEIIGFHLRKEITTFYEGINGAFNNDSLLNQLTSKLGVLNMLNTKYIILPTKTDPMPLQNPQANGNAWFVKNLKYVANADSEIVSLYNINTKMQAVIQQKNKPAIVADNYTAEGKIMLQSYKPNELEYTTESNNKQFAVFSEIYYPKGWDAYIDGAYISHTNVNYLLRGMEIPAGKHKITFKFEPSSYKMGNNLSLLGSIVVLVSAISGILLAYKRKEISF